MKFGEAIVKAREEIKLNKGVYTLDMPPHEERMSYKELCRYYNDKLFRYWLSILCEDIPAFARVQTLKYLLGRTKCQG